MSYPGVIPYSPGRCMQMFPSIFIYVKRQSSGSYFEWSATTLSTYFTLPADLNLCQVYVQSFTGKKLIQAGLKILVNALDKMN